MVKEATILEGELRPIPDRLVVLTFDDGCKSDLAFVAPLLAEFGFGATFFVTEGFGVGGNYMTWDQVRQVHEMGFEVANHTRGHLNVANLSKNEFLEELEYIEARCRENGIPEPTTFCYPGFQYGRNAVEVLEEKGYLFARRGPFPEVDYDGEGQRGCAYDPKVDHPLLVPVTGFSGPHWGLDDLAWAVDQAAGGHVAVLNFHGVPDVDHPWVHTDPKDFEKYMVCLRDRNCTVIAMRDLAKYIDPAARTDDPLAALERKLK